MSSEPLIGKPGSALYGTMGRLGAALAVFLDYEVTIRGRLRVSGPELLVVGLAAVVNVIVCAGGSALYFPDSANYVLGAYNIFYDGNFHVGFARTPGYALFLSPIVGLAGANAITVMAIVQHGLMVFISLCVVKIGDQLDPSRVLGLVAGALSAFSLQLIAYANLPMSEVLYAFLATWGLLYALRFLRSDKAAPLVLAAALFSTATVVRPAGQYLALALIGFAVLRLFIPALRTKRAGGPETQRARVRAVVSAATVCFVVATPWMFFNFTHYGFFGLGGNPGLNLYSNTIEYGRFQDNDSPALADIQHQWAVSEAKRVARGEKPESRYTWRNHWSSMAHYTDATGLAMWRADKVFLAAALDAIRAHPGAYVRHVVDNVYRTFIHTEAAHLYLPGFRTGDGDSGYRKYALPVTNLEGPRRNLEEAIERRTLPHGNPARFHPPTALTPVYGWLAFAYQSVHVYGVHWLAVVAAGFGLAVWKGFRPGGIVWWALLAYVAYMALVPMLVVPASPRHRLPADPAITILYATFLIFAAEAAWRAVRRLACLVWDRN